MDGASDKSIIAPIKNYATISVLKRRNARIGAKRRSAVEREFAILLIFDPCEINIRVGDRVIWINDSHCNQTIISDNHRCDIDQTLCPRERLELKFRKPGRWIYRSRHHRHFVGIIKVTTF